MKSERCPTCPALACAVVVAVSPPWGHPVLLAQGNLSKACSLVFSPETAVGFVLFYVHLGDPSTGSSAVVSLIPFDFI